jgi:hypothetical protein
MSKFLSLRKIKTFIRIQNSIWINPFQLPQIRKSLYYSFHQFWPKESWSPSLFLLLFFTAAVAQLALPAQTSTCELIPYLEPLRLTCRRHQPTDSVTEHPIASGPPAYCTPPLPKWAPSPSLPNSPPPLPELKQAPWIPTTTNHWQQPRCLVEPSSAYK